MLEKLSMGCRPLHCRDWVGIFGSSVCTCFTRCARPPNYFQPHMSYGKSLYASVTFAVTAGSRMLGKESTWDVVWPSNTSGLGQRKRSTRFSRYLSRNPPDSLSLLSLHEAVLPGDYRLEVPISPQHPTFVGSFRLHRPPEFPYNLRLDAIRERDGVHQGQS